MADELEFSVITAYCDMVAGIGLEFAGFSRHIRERSPYQLIDSDRRGTAYPFTTPNSFKISLTGAFSPLSRWT
jgi:hypothetical protein